MTAPPPAAPCSPPAALAAALSARYAEQLRTAPDDLYLLSHARPATVATQVRVFGWYAPFLTSHPDWPDVAVLDWGCRHAPDSCLLRAAFGGRPHLHGADFEPPDRFAAFHRAAGLRYHRLDHVYRLPYPDESFQAVVASGTLEHAAMDYESLKELWRVLRPGGRLVVTYLPNRWSVGEWRKRRWPDAHPPHPRLYSLAELRHLLLHHGFRPRAVGYQTRYDALGGAAGWKRWPVRAAQLHRFTSTLCGVGEKVPAME